MMVLATRTRRTLHTTQARHIYSATAALALAVLVSLPVLAQYPTAKRTPKPTTNPRAVAVLEWTGDPGKPSASRLVPISIFVDGRLQDGGLYMSRPVPMTLESGTVYELQTAGKPTGYFDVNSAGHVPDSQFSLMWFGYGVWSPLRKPSPPRPIQLAQGTSGHTAKEAAADRPTFAHKPDTSGGTPTKTASPAPNATTNTPPGERKETTKDAPVTVDPNGNTEPATAAKKNSPADAPTASTPADDPDRPTLKKRPAGSQPSDSATSGSSPATIEAEEKKLLDDPNRPKLHRGPSTGEAVEPPKLTGTPPTLQQMVAVSDATSREPHSFTYTWTDAQQAATMQKKLEAVAQAALVAAGAPVMPPPKQPATHRTGANSKLRHANTNDVATPAGPVLVDEKFNAYELSYEGGTTLVLTAHTSGEGAKLKYVAIVGILDIYGDVQVLMKSVTDAAHLNDTPRMRLVDAVDADASNRADLLFELRGAGQRQFALYRVAGAKAEQVLITDPLP